MNDIIKWMSQHPLKSAGFAALFGFLPPFLAAMPESWAWPGACVFFLCALAWGLICHFDLKELAAIILAALMVPVAIAQEPPRREQQEGIVGIGVGIVVLCGGGYCVYKLVKFCQKKFPKEATNTNDPPVGLVGFLNVGGGTGMGSGYGGSKNKGNIGSCDPGDMEFIGDEEATAEPITFIIDCVVESGPRVRHSLSFRKGDNTHQTWQEFRAEVEAEGLYLTGNADGSEYFSKDGIPCLPGDVPLSFSDDGTIIHQSGGFPRTVAISRSTNLVDWVSLMQTTVGEGTGFQVVDTSTHATMFFKVELVGR